MYMSDIFARGDYQFDAHQTILVTVQKCWMNSLKTILVVWRVGDLHLTTDGFEIGSFRSWDIEWCLNFKLK